MTALQASLFRPEALSARDETFSLAGANPLPLSHRVLSLLSVLFVVAVAALLYHGSYAPRHAVRGIVTTTQANVRVVARQPGTVTEIFVSEDTLVKRGEPLLRIEDLRHTSSQDVNVALHASLRSELLALEKEALHANTLAANDASAADLGLQNIKLQLATLQREHQLAQAQRALSDAQHRRLLAAAVAVPARDVERAHAEALAAASQQAAASRQLLQQRAAYEQLRHLQANAPLRLAAQLADIESRKERLRQQMLRVSAAAESTVRAPMTGRISGLVVRPGATVNDLQPLLTLLPATADYVVDLLVSDRAAGLLSRGDSVQLRFDAFPYQHFGAVRGRVSSVSASTVLASDLPARTTQAARGFLVRVELPAIEDRPALPLRAGMTVAADILQNERRLIDWMLAPLRGAATRLRP